MKLTDRSSASGASLTDLIHVVKTGDTSQNSAGSSYKIPMGAYAALFGGSNSGDTYWTSGSTWNTGSGAIKTNNASLIDSTGIYAVAEGNSTTASGDYSHAQGDFTIASGYSSHAEGSYASSSYDSTVAGGWGAHAEGLSTKAYGQASHSEGQYTTAGGDWSHAGGLQTKAMGLYSFVHGTGSTASGDATIVLGANITGTTSNTTFVETLALVTVRDYANDAAADADTTLPSGGLYTTSGSTGRVVYRKP